MDMFYSAAIRLLFVVVLLSSNSHADEQDDDQHENKEYNYMSVIDAGSSGSRIYVYKWLTPNIAMNNGVPEVEEVGNLKQEPGISAYADDPAGVDNQLIVMINKAKELIPMDKHSISPIFLMATAGVRLVEYAKQQTLFAEIHKVFENKELSPFEYSKENSYIISGEEEGAFSWISVNYNTGFVQSDAVDVSYGLLEMGGASTQIAFIPEGQILANKFVVKVGIHDYSMYIHSYLYHGQEYTAINVREHLHLQQPSASVLNNPCMLQDDSMNDTFGGLEITFQGSGNPTECSDILRSFIWNVTADQCYPSPCTIGNVYQAPLGKKIFYGVVNFAYTPSIIGGLDSNMKLSLQDLRTEGNAYCMKNMDAAVQQIGEGQRRYASNYCMLSLYIPLLLHDGLGFSLTEKQIISTNDINGKSVSWTLGAALYEIGKKCADGSDVSGSSGLAHLLAIQVTLGGLVTYYVANALTTVLIRNA